ncbi:SDR family NAD(P)-dependent oxidoreductase, partial [Candidatus Frankia nodulisporulans]
TGGTGTVGAHVARALARGGVRRLVLASRRGPASPGAGELIRELDALGARASAQACDVGDESALAALLRRQVDAGEPVTAVVHAAGVAGAFRPLLELTLGEVAEVVAGKVAGASALVRLLPTPDGDSITEIALVSSIAAVWGSGNQAAYSAANAYLDALAGRADTGRCRITALAYGPWDGDGLAATPALREFLTRRGLRPLDPAQAAAILAGSLGAGSFGAASLGAGHPSHPVAAGARTRTIVDVDWDRFLPSITAARDNRFFTALSHPDPSVAPGAGGSAEHLGIAARTSGGSARHPGDGVTASDGSAEHPGAASVAGEPSRWGLVELVEMVRAQAADVLGYESAQEVELSRRFLELGFDSLASVELRRRLVAATGLGFGTQAVFEHPTVTELAAHLAGLAAAAPATVRPAAVPSATTSPAAVPSATTRSAAVPSQLARPALAHPVAGGEAVGVRGVYRQACAEGKFAAGVGVLRAAAKLRAVCTSVEGFGAPGRPVRLASGPAPFALVCLPSMVAPSGPHTFARLALHLHGRRDVHALAHPGFGGGEPLPATADLVIARHVDTITRAFAGRPIVLAGYSSGGWLAHAIASVLQDRGMPPAAVVLLDTWLPTDRIPEHDIQEELRGIAVNEQAYALMTEAQVTAQGAYLDLFENWRPRAVAAPVMLVRARVRPRRGGHPTTVAEDVTGIGQAWTSEWTLEHDSFDVAGDHQSMMHEHSAATAHDLHRWLSGVEGRQPAHAAGPPTP